MKKLLIVSSVLLGLASLVVGAGLAPEASATQAPLCKAVAVGTKNSANQPGSIFTIQNGKVTGTYKLTGSANCKLTMELQSWTAPNPTNGKPYNLQKKYDSVVKTAGPGTYTLTANLKDCYYQVDFVWKGTAKYSDRNIGYAHGGTRPCDEKPPVTPPVVKIQVCEIATKKLITIDEKAFDSSKHTKDFDKCKETPVTPPTPPVTPPTPPVTPPETPEVPQTPPELPETGPAAAIMQLFGAGSMVASAAYYVQSRRS